MMQPDNVPGHTSRLELFMLRMLVAGLKVEGAVVEIGSYKGRSSAALGLEAKRSKRHLYCIDTWAGEGDAYDDEGGTGEAALTACKNHLSLCGLCLTCDVSILKDTGVHVAKGFSEPVAMVFIDGNHSGEYPTEDAQAWLPKISPGGVVALHDCRENFKDVRRAWDKIVLASPRLDKAFDMPPYLKNNSICWAVLK